MRLWSIQRIEAYQALLSSGVLRASPSHIDPFYFPAYAWMSTQLENKVARPEDCAPVYPVWAWLQYKSQQNPKPKLGDPALLPPGSKGVLIEFQANPEAYLASDFQKWHAVLNKDYLPLNRQEQLDFEAWAKGLPAAQAQRLVKARVERSWTRIFDVDAPASDCWGGPLQRELQVVLWQIERDWIDSVEFFQSPPPPTDPDASS